MTEEEFRDVWTQFSNDELCEIYGEKGLWIAVGADYRGEYPSYINFKRAEKCWSRGITEMSVISRDKYHFLDIICPVKGLSNCDHIKAVVVCSFAEADLIRCYCGYEGRR